MLFNYIKLKQVVRRYATWTKFRIYPKMKTPCNELKIKH